MEQNRSSSEGQVVLGKLSSSVYWEGSSCLTHETQGLRSTQVLHRGFNNHSPKWSRWFRVVQNWTNAFDFPLLHFYSIQAAFGSPQGCYKTKLNIRCEAALETKAPTPAFTRQCLKDYINSWKEWGTSWELPLKEQVTVLYTVCVSSLFWYIRDYFSTSTPKEVASSSSILILG